MYIFFNFFFPCFFLRAACFYHNCQASWNGHSYRQNQIVKTTPSSYFFLFPHHGKTFLYKKSHFLLFSSPRYSVELISPLILQMRYSKNNWTNISSVKLNLGYINLGYRRESDPENPDLLFYWRPSKLEGWWPSTQIWTTKNRKDLLFSSWGKTRFSRDFKGCKQIGEERER